MQELIRQVREKDFSASDRAKVVGRAANPELIKMAKDADPDIRYIVMLCLSETGGKEAALAQTEALADSQAHIRGVAVSGLHRNPDPSVYKPLLAMYDKSKASYVRQQIPLIVARMEGTVQAKDLQERLAKETNGEAREGLIVALAKLGDKPAQSEFLVHLDASKERDRKRYLEHCNYIHARWLLKPMGKLLDDTEPMERVGVDGMPELTEHLRTCDIAIQIIASISGHKFSFPTDSGDNFTDAQRDEVRRYVAALPEPPMP